MWSVDLDLRFVWGIWSSEPHLSIPRGISSSGYITGGNQLPFSGVFPEIKASHHQIHRNFCPGADPAEGWFL